jgi:hypothetical protein
MGTKWYKIRVSSDNTSPRPQNSRPGATASGKLRVAHTDGSYQPNGWMVEGYNRGTTDLVVRPWVICANVS